MQKEIGSDFWHCETTGKKNTFFSSLNNMFFMTGRTALDFIINDIKSKKQIKNVYMPSYCCESMIVPFLKNDIKIDFYDIKVTENGIKCLWDFNKEADIVYLIQYFGFEDNSLYEALIKYKEKGCFVIEDITHSLLFNSFSLENADYCFASLRKWTGIADGAFATGIEKKESGKAILDTNENFVNLRQEAEILKENYIQGRSHNKEIYLSKFSEAEDIIDIDYENYSMSEASFKKILYWDIENVKKIRRENAKYLMDNLSGVNNLKCIYNNLSEIDVPLFFPVLIKNGCRDLLRKYLSENGIYCPIHWQKSDNNYTYGEVSEIYEEELSIICDQRYNTDDMNRIVNTIKKIMNNIV